MIRKEMTTKLDRVRVTFVVPREHPHRPVAVVGDFNSWNAEALPLKRRSNGSYSASVTLKAGKRYAFRYRCEGGHWCNDEAADAYERNAFGSDNCILTT